MKCHCVIFMLDVWLNLKNWYSVRFDNWEILWRWHYIFEILQTIQVDINHKYFFTTFWSISREFLRRDEQNDAEKLSLSILSYYYWWKSQKVCFCFCFVLFCFLLCGQRTLYTSQSLKQIVPKKHFPRRRLTANGINLNIDFVVFHVKQTNNLSAIFVIWLLKTYYSE